MNYLGGGDVEALHPPDWGVEAGLLSLRDHSFLRGLLTIERNKLQSNFTKVSSYLQA